MLKSVFQLFSLLALLSLSVGATGQTLHFIASIDQVNDDIRQGCAKDYQAAYDLFKAIAQDAKMRFNHQKLPFDQGSVESYLNHSFTCGPNDVVVFLFSGHGFRYEEDDDDWPWPYLFYCNREQSGAADADCEVDMDWVQEMLIDRNPRMSLVLGDCCNDVLNSPAANATLSQFASVAEDSDPNAADTYANLDLIRSFRGHIIASAAKPGQQAETDNTVGSHFFGAFRYFLLNALQSQQPTSWENILTNTRSKVMQLSNNQQTPLFRVTE